MRITVTVNDRPYTRAVEARLLLSDFLRHDLALTGTHVGCEHGVCGACTVLLDGVPVRSCLTFAVQAGGHAVRTVEGLAADADALHPLQEASGRRTALQCGFCTPGFLMTLLPFLDENPDPSDDGDPRRRSPATSAAAPATRTSCDAGAAGRRSSGARAGQEACCERAARRGRACRRNEDPRLLTGQAQFVDDVHLPGWSTPPSSAATMPTRAS